MVDTPNPSKVRVRMAPSPTGPVHVGNIHTALFNWLFARKFGGTFVLRFEDTDRERSERKWENVIYEEMRWLGLDWDEGPDIGGPYGPYRQTERLDIYHRYVDQLLAQGDAYYCYCSPEELAAERQAAERGGQTYRYSGRCLHLSEAERAALAARLAAEGRSPAVRLHVPAGITLAWDDLVRGRIETESDTIGDFVILRGNGIPVYNFAVVIDDITMKITHILRGEGHISNTPMQLLVYRALGVPAPQIGHLGHILGTDRQKLSKRNGDAYVGDYRAKGFLPEALFNFLALLGWTPEDEQEVQSREQLIEKFSLERLTKAPSIFDLTKLEWLNGVYIRELSVEEFARRCLPYLQKAGLVEDHPSATRWTWIQQVLAIEQPRVKTLADIVQATEYFFKDDIEYDEKAVRKVLKPESRLFLQDALQLLEKVPPEKWQSGVLEGLLHEYVERQGVKNIQVFQPIRVAVSGRAATPPLFDTLALLGREKTLARLRHTLAERVPKENAGEGQD